MIAYCYYCLTRPRNHGLEGRWTGMARVLLALAALLSFGGSMQATEPAPKDAAKTIVFLGGVKTHGPGAHEHLKDAQSLKRWLDAATGLPPLQTPIYLDAWPDKTDELDRAATIVMLWEGWGAHLLNSRHPERVKKLDELMRRGVGLVCLHAATAVDDDVEHYFLDWVGGNKKKDYSLHPMARNVELSLVAPGHAVCRGVRPMHFAEEEFYCRIMFRPGDRRITPILTAMLPPEKPEKQVVAWCCQRADGGRAFACTGPHYRASFQNGALRTLVLNAILWTAGLEVPPQECASHVSPAELAR